MLTILMIAIVVLNVSILVFGIRSGVETYVAYRRNRRKADLGPQSAPLYKFPTTNSKPVHKRPAA
jgi:hypothetical protein